MAYEQQISWRLKNRALPAATKYAVIPDPEGKRVGSGGATLNVLRYITEHDERELSQLRIMVLHSGGDAKRTPQYSACGKIFSPVPRMLPNGRRSTLFDEFMISMCGIPARISSGMLVCSGDVLLLFNSLQLDFYEEGAAALSIKESAEVGKNHGVFLGSGDGYVRRFLHKQSVENLKKVGAADQRGMINIDTGAVIFSGGLVKALYSLADTPEKFAAMVNEKVRLSFYADFLYPLAEDSTLEQFYKEQPEGELSPELDAAREKIWEKLSGYRMKLIRFSPSSFLHFGTTRELLKLNAEDIGSYGELGWRGVVNSNYHGEGFAASNSYISTRAKVGAGSYIEDSYIHHNAVIGKGCVISGCTIGKARSGKNEKPIVIPDGTVTIVSSCRNEHHFRVSEVITEGIFQLFDILFLCKKYLFQLLPHTDDADTALGLRISQFMLSAYVGQRVVYRDSVVLEVDILPSKSKALSRTHTRVKQNLDDTLEVLVPRLTFEVFHEPFELVFL